MSVVFRLKYALGLIPSADQLDAKWEKLIKMRDDLNLMENSDELRQYEDLKNLIDSSTFQHKKREIESLQYGGSEEETLVLEHKALAKSHTIRNYQKISGSDRLMRLEKILKGEDLKTFLNLQREVESTEFKNRRAAQKKKEYLKSDDYDVQKRYDLLRKSDDIRFWHKFGKSENYRDYLNTIGSKELKRLEELKTLTESADFIGRVAYLKDKHRFSKSEEFKRISEFKELDKSKFMADYRKLKQARELDFFEKWEVVLNENFSGKELNTEQWQAENWLGYRMTGESFSQEDEMQGFNGTKNIQIINNTLSLWAKKEKKSGKAWNPALGLVPKHYEYTSAILNSAPHFRFKEGVLEVKVRFKKDATITSAMSLTGESPFPQIDLFRSTKHGVGMGILEKKENRPQKYMNLNGLNDSHFHVFRLEIFNNLLTWKINGVEVFRDTTYLKEPLFLNLLTSLHGNVNEHLLPHRFEVDWIRCFSKK